MHSQSMKRVVLAGGGHAHLAVLADWARKPLPAARRWLVTSSRYTAYSGMVPGWLAGFYSADDLMIDLAPLAERAGAELVLADVIGLDAEKRKLALSTGETLEFDLLSLATGGETDTSALAVAGQRLLPVRPMCGFIAEWRGRIATDTGSPPQEIVVVGGGAAGVELAFAICVAHRRAAGMGRVSIVTPEERFLAGHDERVQALAKCALLERGITMHFAHAVGTEGGLLLSNGRFLAADCIVAATGSRAPLWLAQSGLACTPEGFVAVGPDMRSTSHDAIFAAGDIIERADRRLERSGVHAVKAGPVLAANLRAALGQGAVQRYKPRRRTLYLLALGDRRAIFSWGPIVGTGRWAWRLKDWIDRSFVRRYTSHGSAAPGATTTRRGKP
ncbi:pyridine nucleotide-disulfide oxidoreductase [Novosphingobium sediminis]|uniref:Pyridine nucleotide-disulfide oxidoreductase n=1 Tax=Novosphingobium sediminis TaxID=707214 RepID=A0A512APN7_9SPHN|nr:FAD-dependent oxidoreductase [Novosphingobium sediminis]GEO01567.1 pyridine nucleotide-disulfide oxidoreductase [Novosphingobium sediminis]